MFDATHYALLGLFVLAIAVGLIQVWGYCKFQRLLHLPVIKKRFPRLVQTEARVVICFMFVLALASLNMFWINVTTDSSSVHTHQLLHDILGAATRPPISHFLSHIEALRLWLMFYELNLLKAMQHEAWGNKIACNFWMRDFYLRHRSTRGNMRWLSKRLFVYWLVLSALSGISAYYVMGHELHVAVELSSYLIRLVLLILPLAFIGYLWKKVPTKEGDSMLIEEEFKMTCYAIALSLIGYVIAGAVMALGNQHRVTSFIVATAATIWISSAPSLIATVWIPVRLSSMRTATAGLKMEGLILEKGIFKNRHIAADGSCVENIRDELAILYNDEAKMEALGGWAMKRFAVESFLCFVEMVQFKERVISLVNAQNSEFDERAVVRHRLYEHCPRSSIVFNRDAISMQQTDDADRNADVFVVKVNSNENEEIKEEGIPGASVIVVDPATNDLRLVGLTLQADSVHSLRQSARALFKKYVHGDAALQINVSYELRSHLLALDLEDYSSLTAVTWISLFDDTTSLLEEYIRQLYVELIGELCAKQESGKGKAGV